MRRKLLINGLKTIFPYIERSLGIVVGMGRPLGQVLRAVPDGLAGRDVPVAQLVQAVRVALLGMSHATVGKRNRRAIDVWHGKSIGTGFGVAWMAG